MLYIATMTTVTARQRIVNQCSVNYLKWLWHIKDYIYGYFITHGILLSHNEMCTYIIPNNIYTVPLIVVRVVSLERKFNLNQHNIQLFPCVIHFLRNIRVCICMSFCSWILVYIYFHCNYDTMLMPYIHTLTIHTQTIPVKIVETKCVFMLYIWITHWKKTPAPQTMLCLKRRLFAHLSTLNRGAGKFVSTNFGADCLSPVQTFGHRKILEITYWRVSIIDYK